MTNLSSTFEGIIYLIGTKLITGGTNVGVNVYLGRTVSPEVYGIAMVECKLILSCILSFSRDLLREASYKTPLKRDRVKQQHVHAVSTGVWLGVCVAILIAFGCFWVSTQNIATSSNDQDVPDYTLTVFIYCVSAILETIAELFYIIVINLQLFSVRSAAELSAYILRGVSTLLTLVITEKQLLSFGIGQIVYACTLIFTFITFFVFKGSKIGVSLIDLLPRYHIIRSTFSKKQGVLWDMITGVFSLFTGTALRFMLTEGEKFILVGVSDSHIMGVYSFVNNLGSYIARYILQPMEEMSRASFGKIKGELDRSINFSSPSNSTFARNNKSEIHENNNNDDDVAEKVKKAKGDLISVLFALIRIVGILGLAALCFGPAFAHLPVGILYGTHSESDRILAHHTLSAYCCYILFMAYNGILEGFVQSVSSPKQLQRAHLIYAVLTSIYIATAYQLISYYGAVGIVYSNIINMFMRICYGIYFVFRFDHDFDPYATHSNQHHRSVQQSQPSSFSKAKYRILHLLPHPFSIGAFFISSAAVFAFDQYTQRSGSFLRDVEQSTSLLSRIQTVDLFHVFLGVFLAFGSLLFTLRIDPSLKTALTNARQAKRN
eukprot:gb/GECH01002102.1/.p1 GENE.gb/GECH01002102.1/~~gb/GECH01002102.1/.p1  ORF type:complete len:605 (+),score=126.26 gb/GECH01002102.1/:1-1815(+)